MNNSLVSIKNLGSRTKVTNANDLEMIRKEMCEIHFKRLSVLLFSLQGVVELMIFFNEIWQLKKICFTFIT